MTAMPYALAKPASGRNGSSGIAGTQPKETALAPTPAIHFANPNSFAHGEDNSGR